MGSTTDETARVPGQGPGATAAGAAACDWADLAEWMAHLCAIDSPCLPAAMWMIATCTSPAELLQPTARERRFLGQLGATYQESQVLWVAAHAQAQAPKRTATASASLWSDLADVAKRMFERFPRQFSMSLCFLCFLGKELDKREGRCEPTASELEALLDQVDGHHPELLAGIGQIMATDPGASAVAARWRPPERPPEQVIARKVASFSFRVLKTFMRADSEAERLTAELVNAFPELPLAALEGLPEDTLAELPLATLVALEQIVDDDCLSLPGKIGAMHKVLAAEGPVCH